MTEDGITACDFRHSTRAGMVKSRRNAAACMTLESRLLNQHSWWAFEAVLGVGCIARVCERWL
jgi:hypothetical protein